MLRRLQLDINLTRKYRIRFPIDVDFMVFATLILMLKVNSYLLCSVPDHYRVVWNTTVYCTTSVVIFLIDNDQYNIQSCEYFHSTDLVG